MASYDEDRAPLQLRIPDEGVVLLDALSTVIGRFVTVDEHQRTAIALWTVATYCLDIPHGTNLVQVGRVSPILAIVSPRMRCGKTTLLGLLARLVRRPLAASN